MWIVRCLFIRCRFDSALKLLKHDPQMKLAQRPKESLPTTRRFPANDLRLLGLDLRTQEAVKALEALSGVNYFSAPNERGVKTL